MKTILIADDSLTARMIVKRCLQMVGYKDCRFLEAPDGAQAASLAAADLPALIIADLNMPGMDGEAMLADLKSRAATRDIPVLIASSALNPTRRERLKGLGAHAMLPKPISPASLKDALGALAPGEP